MIEFLLGVLLSPYLLLLAFVCAFAFEYKDGHGASLFWSLVTIPLAYVFFNPTLDPLWGYVVVYPIIGFAWSLWRWKRHIRSVVQRHKRSKTYRGKTGAMEDVNPIENKTRIAHWILAWPISFLVNILSDLLKLTETFVKKYVNKIYNYLAKDAKKTIDEIYADDEEK